MNLSECLGEPVHDPDETLLSRPVACDPPRPVATPEDSPQNRRICVAAVIAAGLLGVAVGWTTRALPPAAPPPVTESLPPGVAGAAELFAQLYFAGNSEGLSRIYSGVTPAPSGAWVNQVAALDGRLLDADRWQVTVAVDTLEQVDGVYRPADIGFFTVTLDTTGDLPRVTAPPARIPAPDAATRPRRPAVNMDSEQADVARGFIELYLTGDPSAARHLAHPNRHATFTTPPYAAASVTEVSTDNRGGLVATVTASTDSGVTHVLRYRIALVAANGEWKVSSIGAATP